MSRHDDGGLDLVFGLILGLLGGTLFGLLFAPKKGKDLQEDLQRVVDTLPDRLTNQWANSKEQYKDLMGRTRYRIQDQVEQFNARRQAQQMRDAKQREAEETGVFEV